MIRSIAAAFTAAWSILGAQSGYGQPPSEAGKIYWTDSQRGIHRSSLDGSNVEQLVIPDLRGPDKIALDVAGGRIYWTERGGCGIHRSDLDGSNTETIVEGYGAPRLDRIIDITLDVAGGKIYWPTRLADDFSSFIVSWSDLDGSNDEILFWEQYHIEDSALDLVRGKVYWTDTNYISWADLNGPREGYIPSSASSIALDVDSGKIYWINPDTQTIQRADLNGQNAEHFFAVGKLHLTGSLAAADIALDLDGGKIYWTDSKYREWGLNDWGTGTLQRADLDGQNREVLFDPIVRRTHGIALDVDKMYWSDSIAGSILRANLDGSGMEVLVTGLDEPKGIALTAGHKIYWADSGTGKIQTADLDGSQVEDIVTGLDRPSAIALDRGRSKIYWSEWETIRRANLNGSQVEEIAPVDGWPPLAAIALDENSSKIYWSDESVIFRANLDGSHTERFDHSEHSIRALALDLVGRRIYWTNLEDPPSIGGSPSPNVSEIFRSSLDGSNVERIQSMSTWRHWGATGIALYIPHPTSVATPSTTPAIPTTSGLSPNFPNPFNAHTQIAYRLATPGPVRLAIYNVLGQPVRTLINQFQPAGFYQVPWDARDQRGAALAAGVYLTRLHHPDGTQTRRLLYLK